MKPNQKIRVVIIEDYHMTRSLLRIILRGEEFDVVGEAIDGQSGVAMCKKLKPDIVLLDIIMPNLNGLEALAEIRADNPEVLVIMVSRLGDEEVVNQAMQAGANGYIVKPFNTASVIETMNEAREQFILRAPAKRDKNK
ncbi:MAG: response regulator [Burkholderiaceae bacterium]|jgi:DNA-binding NarL/FixJ family response regulator|nr:response regulator [Burkholderiaceae bacterium]